MKFKRILSGILFIISASVFLFSAYKLASYFLERKEAADTYTDYTQKAVSVVSDSEASEKEEVKKDTPGISVNFDYLSEKCEDIIGWIYSPETVINYPVVQAEDNEKYLHRLPEGKYNASGSIFADCRNIEIGEDLNFILYGHHMKNDSMFGSLLEYRNQKYYDKHPVMYYYTPEKSFKIELLAGFVTPADSDIYNLKRTEAEMPDFIDKIQRKSNFKSKAEYKGDEKLITLSTCTNTSDDKRYVVIGILKEIN